MIYNDMLLKNNYFDLFLFILLVFALSACAAPSNKFNSTKIIKDNPANLRVSFQKVYDNLHYPLGLLHAGDDTQRIYVIQQTGEVVYFPVDKNNRKVFLDISEKVNCCGESGLLGLAFHPDFKSNGLFFVNYIDKKGDTIIARYTTNANHTEALPDSEIILLEIKQPINIHNGGQMSFGPDGYLYIGTGDGGSYSNDGGGNNEGDGSGGDPYNRAQNTAELLGKILRIDVDYGSSYRIPTDNPFVNNPDARGEIWSLGFKNPWRFSFDRVTGDLYITDVGQVGWEEINFQPANSSGGENYGWRKMEGTACYKPARNCNDGSLTLPVAQYSHDYGCAIIGGYVYRGKRYEAAYGSYVFSDFCSGRIWQLVRQPEGEWAANILVKTNFNISSFGEDQDGELYILHRDEDEGSVYRLIFE